MASCERMNPESDEEEVDLESLRLAALQTLHEKPKFVPVNHNNLIPIVPLNVEPPAVSPKIKLEPISPTLEKNIQVDCKFDVLDFEEGDEIEEEDESSESENGDKNDRDILSMDDKDEEDSLERLMDQLEAEISGQAPIAKNRTVLSSKQSSKQHKEKKKKVKKEKKKDETEVALIGVKLGKQQGEIINLRESKSPQPADRSYTPAKKNSKSPDTYRSKSPSKRSRIPFRSRSRSPFRRSRSLRSRSPYWSRSPRRSRSPYRRSRSPRSPFWLRRRSRSPLNKSRSPFRKSRSPYLRKSPLRRYSRSRSRSRSYGRRSPSPWFRSPRRRSRSPFLRDLLSPLPRWRDTSPDRKYRRRTLSPREGSISPRRSRSPRRLPLRRNSPFRRSKSPLRRSRTRSPRRSPRSRRSLSPLKDPKEISDLKRRSPPRFSRSPARRSKSPIRRSSSLTRRSKSPIGQSKLPLRNRSKSPGEKFYPANRSRSYSRGRRSLSFSASPRLRRNRSPLRVVEKNVVDSNDKNDNEKSKVRDSPKDRRTDNRRNYNRKNYKPRGYGRYSPGRDRRTNDKPKRQSKSPDKAKTDEIDSTNDPKKDSEKPENGAANEPLDPVLEARKKKFESLGEVDPSVDKKISLKAIKETSENVEDDEDALNINFENDLWDESEESDHENESRFKCADSKKKPNRTYLSFRNLREGGGINKKINLNKPLLEENPKDRFPRNDRYDRWPRGRKPDRKDRNDRSDRNIRSRYQNEDAKNKTQGRDNRSRNEFFRNKSQESDKHRKPDRKVVLSLNKSSSKTDNNSVKDSAVSTTHHADDKRTRDQVNERTEKVSDKSNKDKLDGKEDDDFDKLMSDFEKELENDLCILSMDSPVKESPPEEPKISPKSDSKTANRAKPSLIVKKPSEINEIFAPKSETLKKIVEEEPKEEEEEGEIKESEEKDQPEDYAEDDDFVIEERPVKRKIKTRINDDDAHSDLRAILSRRRNERLKVVTVQRENVPARLVQSAFQGLKNKKSKHPSREVQSSEDVVNYEMKSSASERRRVLLLKKDQPTVASIKITVPEETAKHRLERSEERRRKRKIQGTKEADQEDEDEGLQLEEKPSRRFRLKRNVTLSSQVQN